jgi:hypothetical protein
MSKYEIARKLKRYLRRAKLQLEGVNLLEQQFFAIMRHQPFDITGFEKYTINDIVDVFNRFAESKRIDDAILLYKYIENARKFLTFVVEHKGKNINDYKWLWIGFSELLYNLGYFYDIGKNFSYYMWLCDFGSGAFLDPNYKVKTPEISTIFDITPETYLRFSFTDYEVCLLNTRYVLTELFPQPMICEIKIHDIKFAEERYSYNDERCSFNDFYKIAVITDKSGTQITLADYYVMNSDRGIDNLNRSAFYEIVAEDLIGTDIIAQMYYSDGKIYGQPLAVITDDNIIYFKKIEKDDEDDEE